MKMPSSTVSGTTLLRQYGLYHSTRLHADRALESMAAGWDAVQARLRDRVAAFEEAQACTMTALAVRDGEEASLAGALRAFYGALVTKTNNDRKSPLFAVYFPEGLGALVDAPMEIEAQRALVLTSKLAEEKDTDLAAHRAPITEAVKRLLAAISVHKEEMAAQLQAYGRVEQEKVAWFDAYKLDHRTLSQMFYRNPKRAESYFKPAARTGKAPALRAVRAQGAPPASFGQAVTP
ncbi:MAG: hypothetical protein AB1347_11150 [Acidobacteriota bacterium]